MIVRITQRATRRTALLAVLLGAIVIAAVALADDAIPAPTLSATPPAVTNQTSASFTYTDAKTGVSFQCALDGSAFTACGTTRPSTKAYPGPLAAGTHSFAVRALSGTKLSPATTFAWTIDRTPPAVASITRVGADPTANATVGWNVTFTEPVTGVGASDFQLVAAGLGAGSAITAVTGSGATYLVTASTATGSGTLRLNLVDDDSIKDAATNPLGGTGTGNGNATGPLYTIDRTPPPAPAISSAPPSLTNAAGASFGFSDSEAGVTFLCQIDAGAFAACTSPKSYAGLADGVHSFSVKARDAAGNLSGATTATWRVDTKAPPEPQITSRPPNPSSTAVSTFAFSDTEAGVTFTCSVEHGPWLPCTSPKTFTVGTTVNGQHYFSVHATDAAGNASEPTSYTWTVTASSGIPFQISGTVGTFVPGRTLPVNLVLTNPNSVPIQVTAITVTVRAATTRASLPNPSCNGTTNLVQSLAFQGPVTVPANTTASLQTLGLASSRWPQLKMPNLVTNQDACKSTTFTLDFSGTANS